MDPLRIHLYDEGLARLAAQPYQPPTPANLAAVTMHLTNYAVNKVRLRLDYRTMDMCSVDEPSGCLSSGLGA